MIMKIVDCLYYLFFSQFVKLLELISSLELLIILIGAEARFNTGSQHVIVCFLKLDRYVTLRINFLQLLVNNS